MKVRSMILAAIFIALGLALPQLFHLIGAGSVFLPMHIPVLLSGFFLSWPYALAVGLLTPLLSSLVTGMPPLFPVLLYMMPELATYGLCVSLLSQKLRALRLYPYIALPVAMIAGRVAAGIAVWLLIAFFGVNLNTPVAFVLSAITTGLPGIVIQIALIPPIVLVLQKALPAYALAGK